MKSLLQLFLVLLALGSLVSCSSNNIGSKKLRGNLQQIEWLSKYSKEEIVQKKASHDEAKNYSLKIRVLVAEETPNGDPWDKDERGELPDLRIYYITSDGNKQALGQKENSLTMFSEYPLNLKGEDTLILRVVDLDKTYHTTIWGDKYTDDTDKSYSKETPLAQLNLTFKGQGRYLYFTGSVLLIIDFIELKEQSNNQ